MKLLLVLVSLISISFCYAQRNSQGAYYGINTFIVYGKGYDAAKHGVRTKFNQLGISFPIGYKFSEEPEIRVLTNVLIEAEAAYDRNLNFSFGAGRLFKFSKDFHINLIAGGNVYPNYSFMANAKFVFDGLFISAGYARDHALFGFGMQGFIRD